MDDQSGVDARLALAAYRTLSRVPLVFAPALVGVAVAVHCSATLPFGWWAPAALAFQVVGVASAQTVRAGGRWSDREAARNGALLLVPACVVMGAGLAAYLASDALLGLPSWFAYRVLADVPWRQSLMVILALVVLTLGQLAFSGALVATFWIAVPVCVVEGLDPISSVARAYRLVRRDFARVGVLFSVNVYLPLAVMAASEGGRVYAGRAGLSVFELLADVLFDLASYWLIAVTPVASALAYRSLARRPCRRQREAGARPRGTSPANVPRGRVDATRTRP